MCSAVIAAVSICGVSSAAPIEVAAVDNVTVTSDGWVLAVSTDSEVRDLTKPDDRKMSTTAVVFTLLISSLFFILQVSGALKNSFEVSIIAILLVGIIGLVVIGRLLHIAKSKEEK